MKCQNLENRGSRTSRLDYVSTRTHTQSGDPKILPSLASSVSSVDRPTVRYSRPMSRNAVRLVWPTALRSKADLAEEAIQ